MLNIQTYFQIRSHGENRSGYIEITSLEISRYPLLIISDYKRYEVIQSRPAKKMMFFLWKNVISGYNRALGRLAGF